MDQSRQFGIGLLEVVLVVIIISSIALASIKLFLTARENAFVNKAVEVIYTVKNAAYESLKTKNEANFNNISLTGLISDGLIPDYYATNRVHPWHYNCSQCLVVSGATEAGNEGNLKIILTDVSEKSCQRVIGKINQDKSVTALTQCLELLPGYSIQVVFPKP